MKKRFVKLATARRSACPQADRIIARQVQLMTAGPTWIAYVFCLHLRYVDIGMYVRGTSEMHHCARTFDPPDIPYLVFT